MQKYWNEWVHVFRQGDINMSELQSCVFGGWFFSQKSLVIIYWVPKDNNTENKLTASESEPLEKILEDNWDKIPEETILILVSYKPDKRTRSWKFFSTSTTIKEFPKKKGKDLTLFVLDKSTLLKWENIIHLIDSKQAEKIVSIVGNNLFNLHYECDKIVHYCIFHNLQKISNETIEWLLYRQDHDSFKVIDTIFSNPDAALEYIGQAQQNNQNEYEFLGMLYRWCKLILNLLELEKQWVSSSKEMAKILSLHPFAVSKHKSKLWEYRKIEDKVSSLFLWLLQLEYNLKTWQYPAEWFWVKVKSLIYGISQ